MSEQEFERLAARGGWSLQSGAWQRGDVRLEVLFTDGVLDQVLKFHGRAAEFVDLPDVAGVLA